MMTTHDLVREFFPFATNKECQSILLEHTGVMHHWFHNPWEGELNTEQALRRQLRNYYLDKVRK
jgi:hypothetical protein